MPLPTPAKSRKLKHRRITEVQVFAREDGLWEVDAQITDVKTRDVQMADGRRPAGVPIHDLRLRLVVDGQLNILESGSESAWIPYAGACDQQGDAYARLVGLNLGPGFRKALMARLGGIHGCTHLTELAQALPTAVIQGFVGEVIDARGQGPAAPRPFQIDRCHALRSDGEVVRQHYPRWFRQPDAKNTEHNPGDALPGLR